MTQLAAEAKSLQPDFRPVDIDQFYGGKIDLVVTLVIALF